MHPSVSEPLTRLPDGTVKQRNPFTGTEVWTVPGRGHRPLGLPRPAPQPLDPAQHGRHCAFCEHRLLETPPEKARIVPTRADDGAPAWQILRHPAAERFGETTPDFRRVPNLFEILSYDYWRLNHGHEPPPDEHHAFLTLTADAMRDLYATTPAVRYVSVFQNWLKPAGASFDHLHKQLVAIDEVGAQNTAALDRLREDPQVFNHAALDVAVAHDLVIAANEHAVMFAGFEGATKINVNTISPWDVRDRVLARLRELRAAGALADGMRIGADARVRPGALRYAD